MEALLNQHREHERDLRDTLITAQRVSDDIRANAEAQARQIVREAEGRSDLLLQKTQARLEDVQREIDGMKMKRREVETTLESTIAVAAQHARVRARAGTARARGEDSAAPAARRAAEVQNRDCADGALEDRRSRVEREGGTPQRPSSRTSIASNKAADIAGWPRADKPDAVARRSAFSAERA